MPTGDYIEAMYHADRRAFACGSNNVKIFHIMIGILCVENCPTTLILEKYGITYEWFNVFVREMLVAPIGVDIAEYICATLPLSENTELVLKKAIDLANKTNTKLDLPHVVIVMLQNPSPLLNLIKEKLNDDSLTDLICSIIKINNKIFEYFVNSSFFNQVIIE